MYARKHLNLIKLSDRRVKIEIMKDKFTFVLTFLVQLRYRIAAELRFCGVTRGAGILLVVLYIIQLLVYNTKKYSSITYNQFLFDEYLII